MFMKVLFHLASAVQFFYGCYYEQMFVQFPPNVKPTTPFGGKLKYLTFLNAMLQTVYFTIALLNDFFGNNEVNPSEKPLIRRIKDNMFSALAFPLSLFVCSTFWGIYAVDRELILPSILDDIFPGWLNHLMHTNIAICAFIELLSSFRMYPPRKHGLILLSLFILTYLVWVHVIFFKTGHWVYPILAVINWPLKVVFYLFSYGFLLSIYTLGETINRAVWSKEIEQTVRAGKKKAK